MTMNRSSTNFDQERGKNFRSETNLRVPIFKFFIDGEIVSWPAVKSNERVNQTTGSLLTQQKYSVTDSVDHSSTGSLASSERRADRMLYITLAGAMISLCFSTGGIFYPKWFVLRVTLHKDNRTTNTYQTWSLWQVQTCSKNTTICYDCDLKDLCNDQWVIGLWVLAVQILSLCGLTMIVVNISLKITNIALLCRRDIIDIISVVLFALSGATYLVAGFTTPSWFKPLQKSQSQLYVKSMGFSFLLLSGVVCIVFGVISLVTLQGRDSLAYTIQSTNKQQLNVVATTAFQLKHQRKSVGADYATILNLIRQSFSSSESVTSIIADMFVSEHLLEELNKGTVLFKVKSATKLLKRDYFLDSTQLIFFYKNSDGQSTTPIPVSKFHEVCNGEDDNSKTLSGLDKTLCFVLHISGRRNWKYLMAMDHETREKWVIGLRYSMKKAKLAKQRNVMDNRIRDLFTLADEDKDNMIGMKEVKKLLLLLNANIKKGNVEIMFERARRKSIIQRHSLNPKEFMRFYNVLTRRHDLEELFLRFSQGKTYMTTDDIMIFLQSGQKQTHLTDGLCQELVNTYEPQEAYKDKQQFSMAGFERFITSDSQQLFDPDHGTVYQDMTRPMAHYFIASSHNTYLAKDQLSGPSKVEMYILALMRGCRYVELDCWDGPDNEPIIYHGHTRTSKILFRNVIIVINLYAFKASSYPLIVSLENHCCVAQQLVMVEHIKKTFGDKLWAPEGQLLSAPSPQELMNKIVIKGKKLPKFTRKYKEVNVIEETDSARSLTSLEDIIEVNEEDKSVDLVNDSNVDFSLTFPGTSFFFSNDNNNSHDTSVTSFYGSKTIRLASTLSNMAALESLLFQTCEQAKQQKGTFLVFSLRESKAIRLMYKQVLSLNVVTHSKLIRIFPGNFRTDSSNYNPVLMWNVGCQIVALNYQTGSWPMHLNYGRFLDNGGCGYVLKPDFMFDLNQMSRIFREKPTWGTKTILRLTIISGIQIPKPNGSKKGEVIDPYIKVELQGIHEDSVQYKTKTVRDNGLNPRWYETFVFTVSVPALAILLFTVKDENIDGVDDFIGFYALPFNSIRQGFRHFHLLDNKGEPFSCSRLFVHVEKSSSS